MSQLQINNGVASLPVQTPSLHGKFTKIPGYPIEYKGDLSGIDSAALNWWMQQQQNAYELELWNLANQYSSPVAKMGRYQDAGLNPNLAYGDTASVSPSASSNPIPSKPTNFEQENKIKKLQLAVAGIAQLANLAQQVTRVVDYVKYGAEGHALQNQLLSTQVEGVEASNRFKKYFQYPLAMSRASGQPVTVTTPEGKEVTVNWNESLDALLEQARTNQALKDTEVKDFILKEIYPYQAANLRKEGIGNQNTQDVYNAILQFLGTDNEFVKLLVYKLVNGQMKTPGPPLADDPGAALGLLAKFGLIL